MNANNILCVYVFVSHMEKIHASYINTESDSGMFVCGVFWSCLWSKATGPNATACCDHLDSHKNIFL